MTSTAPAHKVQYIQLGASGLRVSNPILGAMSFGDPRWMPWCLTEVDALPLLKAAFDMGINTWDTANLYSNGRSEEIIASAIKTYAIPREKLVIMTKCCGFCAEEGTPVGMPQPDDSERVNRHGLSRTAIFSAVAGSLKRLNVDYIDVLQIHRSDPTTPPEETMRALHDLVTSGKVRYIGASSMWTWQFSQYQHAAALHGWTKFVSMQNHYSLLYREEEREMIPYCKATGVGIIPWSPLARGHLARSQKGGDTSRLDSEAASKLANAAYHMGYSKEDVAIIARVEEVAEKKGWSMASVGLAWINGKITAPVVGLGSVKRIQEGLEAASLRLEDEEIAYLEELYVPRTIVGH